MQFFMSTFIFISSIFIFLILLIMTQLLPQSKTNLFHEYQGSGFYIAQFKTPELAIFSYYVESEGQAYLIDPTFQVYPYQQLADKRKSKIISILLTHYHADYVAGHTQFNLPIMMGPKSFKEESEIKIYQMQDNSTFNLGQCWIKVLHTPGHTLQSTCFLLIDSKHTQTALFTGDTIFLGEVGRPDLAVNSTTSKEELAKLLFNSIQKIKKQVNHSVRIYPTHGSGSSCGKNIDEGNFCTLQNQLIKNYALKYDNQVQFVSKILEQMPKPPLYFFHDARLNQTGKAHGFDEHLKNSAKPLTVEQFQTEIEKGSAIIDSRHDFGGSNYFFQLETIKGSYLMTENGFLASWVGTFISPTADLLLICHKQKANDIIERLLRIGYLNIKGYNGFILDQWQKQGLPVTLFKSVDAKMMVEAPNKVHLDVRNLSQWKAGIFEGAKLISLNEIPTRYTQLQGLSNIYVNCRSGGRARLACSILAHKGIQATIVSAKFEQLTEAGAKIVQYK